MIGFNQVRIESAVAAVAREASLGKTGTYANRTQYIRAHLRKKLSGGLLRANRLVISTNTVAGGGVPPSPDICMLNPPSSSVATCNVAFQEINGINGYQGAGAINLGDAGEVIEVRVYYPWRVQIPMMRHFFGDNGVIMLTANSIVKNEAF